MGERMKRRRRPRFGVNLFGYVTGNLGLGISARNTATVLAEHGVPIALTDIDPGGGRSRHDLSHAVLPPGVADRTPHSINLFHLNPVEMAHHLRLNPRWARRDRVSAIVPFWELSDLPKAWLRPLAAMDVILAPTRFIQSAVEKALPDAVCLPYRQAVFVPPDIAPDRARWGLPNDALVFLTSFDLASSIERKNPIAVVGAFEEAFPGRDDVRLVIKVNSAPAEDSPLSGAYATLVRRAEADARIVLVARAMDYRDVLSLYASGDVLVSLHRSEGLGMTLMEAMALGKPVIATGWSGNNDFMTPANSFSVDYTLVPVSSEHPAYRSDAVGDGARWADADVAQCAEFMRALDRDADLRRRMGEQGKRDMAELNEAVRGGELVETLRAAVAPGSPVWALHRRRRADFRRLAESTARQNTGRVYRAVHRRAVAVVRRGHRNLVSRGA